MVDDCWDIVTIFPLLAIMFKNLARCTNMVSDVLRSAHKHIYDVFLHELSRIITISTQQQKFKLAIVAIVL